MNLRRSRPFFAGLVAWLGLGGAVSCSSDDQAPGGGRIEHPAPQNSTKAKPPPMVQGPASGSAAEMSAPSEDRRPSRSDYYEKQTGIKLSPLDKAILEDCPNRAWSKNVPDRRCMKDDECGDGFCDRNRCAPIWTCGAWYGMRCEKNDHCGSRPCIDGRCRSCVSDAECAWMHDVQDPICTASPWVPGSRRCHGDVGGEGDGTVAPWPPPKKLKQ